MRGKALGLAVGFYCDEPGLTEASGVLVVGPGAPAASTLVALITYVTVTGEPTFISAEPFVVAGSISNSNRSVPFCTVTMLPVAATAVPVI